MNIKEFFEKEHKLWVGTLITFLIALSLQLIGLIWEYSWILMVIAGFIGGFLLKTAGKGFLTGFLGISACWLFYLVIFMFMGPIYEFANILASIFGLTDMGFIIIILSVLIGGLIGGLGGLNGTYIANIIYGEKESAEK